MLSWTLGGGGLYALKVRLIPFCPFLGQGFLEQVVTVLEGEGCKAKGN